MLTAFILLSILDFGANGLGLIGVAYILLMCFLAYLTWKTHKQVVQQKVSDTSTSVGYKWVDTNPPQYTPVTKEGTFWFMVIITVIYLVAHFAIVNQDYAPRPAAPTTQTTNQ